MRGFHRDRSYPILWNYSISDMTKQLTILRDQNVMISSYADDITRAAGPTTTGRPKNF